MHIGDYTTIIIVRSARTFERGAIVGVQLWARGFQTQLTRDNYYLEAIKTSPARGAALSRLMRTKLRRGCAYHDIPIHTYVPDFRKK